MLLRVWGRTLRLRCDEVELAHATRRGTPVVFVLWHNRLFFVRRLQRLFCKNRPLTALVSASRDGAPLAKFLSFIGMRSVRGSSSRFGREAVHGLIQELHAGYDVAVTPDGPRGPMYEMKAGALLAARRANAPIVLIGVECRPCLRLRSWDRFRVPLPGARMFVRCERIEPDQLGHGNEALARLRARLIALNGEEA